MNYYLQLGENADISNTFFTIGGAYYMENDEIRRRLTEINRLEMELVILRLINKLVKSIKGGINEQKEKTTTEETAETTTETC